MITIHPRMVWMPLALSLVVLLLTASYCENQHSSDPVPRDAGPDLEEDVAIGRDTQADVTVIADRVRTTDGAPQVEVEAGTFTMGHGPSPPGGPERSVTLTRGYWMDRHEVTVGQWQLCVDVGSCSEEDATSQIENTVCNWQLDRADPHPINCVTRSGAEDYCGWVGGRLPTEAEWEYAARGSDGRTHVWGEDAPTCEHANIYVLPCFLSHTEAVESYGLDTSPFGVRDMAGNVAEFVVDTFDPDAYENLPAVDPINTSDTGTHSLRGGSFNSGDSETYSRQSAFDGVLQPYIGFRCVNDL